MDKNDVRPMGTSLTLFTIGLLIITIGCVAAWNGALIPISMVILIGAIVLCSGFIVSLLERILHALRK
jgi:hypothetical protein